VIDYETAKTAVLFATFFSTLIQLAWRFFDKRHERVANVAGGAVDAVALLRRDHDARLAAHDIRLVELAGRIDAMPSDGDLIRAHERLDDQIKVVSTLEGTVQQLVRQVQLLNETLTRVPR